MSQLKLMQGGNMEMSEPRVKNPTTHDNFPTPGRKSSSFGCTEHVKKMLSKCHKRKMVICFIAFTTLHLVIFLVGFFYVKTSLIKSYRSSFREILHITASVGTPYNDSVADSNIISQSVSKTILLWNMPGDVSYPKVLDPQRCGKCDIITDNSRAKESDAVVLHYHNVTKFSDLPSPWTRNEDQVYVWMCRESPNTTKEIYNLDISKMNNVINWTMTHRLDSDVFFPYAEILHRMHDVKLEKLIKNKSPVPSSKYVEMFYSDVDELIKGKKHLVAWVVGNCGNTKGARARMEISNLLMKAGLDIHRYGRCFKEHPFPPYRSEEAHEQLGKYKFYLAFENTYRCRDYVTYKFWKNAIYSGAVPIVWGVAKSDLQRLAPRHSFIHVEDFATMNDLIAHIKYLDTNATAYREYFKWRENELLENQSARGAHEPPRTKSDWIFSLSETFGYCKLCSMLHDKEKNTVQFKRKTVTSLSDWWYGSESKSCISR